MQLDSDSNVTLILKQRLYKVSLVDIKYERAEEWQVMRINRGTNDVLASDLETCRLGFIQLINRMVDDAVFRISSVTRR